MDIPDVRYARAGTVAIAFQAVGDGPRDLVFSPPLSDLYSFWANPYIRPFLDRLAAEFRLIVFNPRGTGFSDKPRDITLEARMDDIAAVLETLGVHRVSFARELRRREHVCTLRGLLSRALRAARAAAGDSAWNRDT